MYFLSGRVQTCRLEVIPSLDCILAEVFSLFLAFNVLLNRLTHHPVRRPAVNQGQLLYADARIRVELDGQRTDSGGRRHGSTP